MILNGEKVTLSHMNGLFFQLVVLLIFFYGVVLVRHTKILYVSAGHIHKNVQVRSLFFILCMERLFVNIYFVFKMFFRFPLVTQ